jgi:hypothetical protein
MPKQARSSHLATWYVDGTLPADGITRGGAFRIRHEHVGTYPLSCHSLLLPRASPRSGIKA